MPASPPHTVVTVVTNEHDSSNEKFDKFSTSLTITCKHCNVLNVCSVDRPICQISTGGVRVTGGRSEFRLTVESRLSNYGQHVDDERYCGMDS